MSLESPRQSLSDGQLAKVRRLLAEVAKGNAFYRERWAVGVTGEFEAKTRSPEGVAAAVDSWEAFRLRLAFTRKHDLVVDQAKHPPYGSNLTYPLERYTRCHGTSGSTGSPLRWLDTPESWQGLLDQWRRVYAAAGVERGDRVFFAFSFGPFLGFWSAFEAALGLGCLSLPGGGLTSVARLQSMLDQRVTVLCCTPTYALHLAQVARTEKLDLGRGAVRKIIVAGEPGGSQQILRNRIEAGWPGATVYDHYGMTEVGPVAYPCAARPGRLHVIEDAYFVEVVDPASGKPSPPGADGELVLTTLNRLGSPLIRYRTGDIVCPAAPGAEPCACGTWDVALEGGILGRTDDMVVVRGVNVFPSAVEEVVRGFPEIAEYRTEIHAAGALLDLRMQIEVGPGTDGGSGAEAGNVANTARALERAFQTRLGLRVPVEVVEAGTLPRFEMKARRWIRTASAAEAPGKPGATGGPGGG